MLKASVATIRKIQETLEKDIKFISSKSKDAIEGVGVRLLTKEEKSQL